MPVACKLNSTLHRINLYILNSFYAMCSSRTIISIAHHEISFENSRELGGKKANEIHCKVCLNFKHVKRVGCQRKNDDNR